MQLVAEAHNSPKGAGVALEQSGLEVRSPGECSELHFAWVVCYWKTLYFWSFPPGACITLETSCVAVLPCQSLPDQNTSPKITFQTCSIVGHFSKSRFRGVGRIQQRREWFLTTSLHKLTMVHLAMKIPENNTFPLIKIKGLTWSNYIQYHIIHTFLMFHRSIPLFVRLLVGSFNLPLWKKWVRQLGWWNSQ